MLRHANRQRDLPNLLTCSAFHEPLIGDPLANLTADRQTGLKVRAGPLLVRADQYLRRRDGEPVNNRSGHYLAELVGEDAALKVEDDHELQWIDPAEAVARLRHESHAWAVACWLRRG